jgi:hypothetical protein
MINDNKVRAALIQAASDFLTGNTTISTSAGDVENLPVVTSSQIAWENKKFNTQGKEAWCSVFYRPNSPTARTIGPGGIDEVNGFVQIDFNVGTDSGELELLSWNEKARLFFHGGRYFTNDGHSVIVTSSNLSNSRVVENYFRQSLTVAFKSHLKRPQLI